MNYKPILVVSGEPNSIFFEIFFKTIKKIKIKSPLILITSKKLLTLQMQQFKFKKNIKELDYDIIDKYKLDNKSLNLIDIKYHQKKVFEKISSKSNKYIKSSFDIAFKILKKSSINKLINGPVSKKHFLNKKNFYGITEYISHNFSKKKTCMLIYNKELSVCPITTHIPIKKVSKKINQKIIADKVQLINNFYISKLGYKPNIGVLGLNPHCESSDKFNEDEKIIKPIIKKLKIKNYKISGPFASDTLFLKKNRRKFDVILGMYHDQVLSPLKTIYEFDAINITLGLPFIRISPDHGPNENMLGKNLSNPLSLIKAIKFLEKH